MSLTSAFLSCDPRLPWRQNKIFWWLARCFLIKSFISIKRKLFGELLGSSTVCGSCVWMNSVRLIKRAHTDAVECEAQIWCIFACTCYRIGKAWLIPFFFFLYHNQLDLKLETQVFKSFDWPPKAFKCWKSALIESRIEILSASYGKSYGTMTASLQRAYRIQYWIDVDSSNFSFGCDLENFNFWGWNRIKFWIFKF